MKSVERDSDTALLIARSLAFSSGDPELRDLVPCDAAELAWAAIHAHPRRIVRLHRWLCRPGLRWILRGAEAAVLPGIQLHYLVRKRFIEDAASTAIAGGARQVVVVGAGLDALGVRLSRRPERPVCIEVDHPATQSVKRDALAALAAPTGDLRLVAADLAGETLAAALARGRYDPGARTFFVAEGLSMYLQEGGVERLLAACADHAPSGSCFAWTFMEPDEDGRLGFRRSRRGLVDAWLRARGEPFTWGIGRERLAAFVGSVGLEIVDVADDVELRARYLSRDRRDAALAAGEVLCVVRKP